MVGGDAVLASAAIQKPCDKNRPKAKGNKMQDTGRVCGGGGGGGRKRSRQGEARLSYLPVH